MKFLTKHLPKLILLFIISSIVINCQKDDFEKQDVVQTFQRSPRIQLKTGDDVSKKVKAFLKEKTNSTFKVAFNKKNMSLTKGNDLSKTTALGTIDTEKEVVVVNESNIKHTFKVELINQDSNSITNIVVVDTPDGVY